MGRITGRLWDRLFLSSPFQRSSHAPVITHLKWFQKNGISLYCFWPGEPPLPWAKNWRLLLYQPIEVSGIKYLTLGWHRLDFAVCSLPPSLLAYSTTQPFLGRCWTEVPFICSRNSCWWCSVTHLCLTLLQTPWIGIFQARILELGSHFLSPVDLPDPGMEPTSPALQADSFTTEPLGEPPRNRYWGAKSFPATCPVLGSDNYPKNS